MMNQRSLRYLGNICKTSYRSYVPGRATTKGTHEFLSRSRLQLYHKLDVSGLFINPIIHGAPRNSVGESSENDDNCLLAAVAVNNSNCIYTYNRTSKGTWHSKHLANLVQKGVPREALVAVANLGDIRDPMMLPDQVYEAQRLSDLEALDIITLALPHDFIFDIQGNTMDDIHITDEFQMIMGMLEGMAAESMFASYGLVIAFPPYTFHTPAPRKNPNLLPLPAILEDAIQSNTEYCDLLLYPMAPTHALPVTRAMLDADEEYIRDVQKSAIRNPKIQLYEGDNKQDDEDETVRRFSRAAIDPIVCYRGHAAKHVNDDDEVAQSEEVLKQVVEGKSVGFEDGSIRDGDIPMFLVNNTTHEPIERAIGQSLDDICPALASTPLLQDKAVRIAMSQGVDCVVVEAQMSVLMGKCKLKPEDLLHASKTDHIYGNFVIPRTLYADLQKAQASFVPPIIDGVMHDELNDVTVGENSSTPPEDKTHR